MPVWYAAVAAWWWQEIQRQIAAAPAGVLPLDSGDMAWLFLAARMLATLSEAAVYALWWKGRAARLPFWRFVCWVASLSTADLLGFSLGRAAEGSSQLVAALCTALAGPAALATTRSGDSGLAVAFGNLGALTLLRVGMTAWAQSRGTGRRFREALLVTTAAWLVTRFVAAWSFDLARGLSPVG